MALGLFGTECPDKKGCDRLTAKPLIVGFTCIGKLKQPTDHVLKGVNDLCFCYKQNGHLNRWHLNRRDIRMLRHLLNDAEKKLEEANAVHIEGAKGDNRPGN